MSSESLAIQIIIRVRERLYTKGDFTTREYNIITTVLDILIEELRNAKPLPKPTALPTNPRKNPDH